MKSKVNLHCYLKLAIHCLLLNPLEFTPFIHSHLQTFVPQYQDYMSGRYCPKGAVELCGGAAVPVAGMGTASLY